MDDGALGALVRYMLESASGAATHEITAARAWHGRLMVLAWGTLLPLGLVLARYYKVTSSQDWPRELDNRFWWVGHRLTQYLGIALMTIAVALVWSDCPAGGPRWPCRPSETHVHSLLGLTVVSIGWVQVLLGLVRGSKGGPTDEGAVRDNPATWRGDHYDMTPRRVFFEWTHKTLGYVAIALAVFAIVSGLARADAPRWMFLVIGLWWTALVLWASRLQRAGRSIDTYQAIWGPGPHHPGAQRRPIGFGIRRR